MRIWIKTHSKSGGRSPSPTASLDQHLSQLAREHQHLRWRLREGYSGTSSGMGYSNPGSNYQGWSNQPAYGSSSGWGYTGDFSRHGRSQSASPPRRVYFEDLPVQVQQQQQQLWQQQQQQEAWYQQQPDPQQPPKPSWLSRFASLASPRSSAVPAAAGFGAAGAGGGAAGTPTWVPGHVGNMARSHSFSLGNAVPPWQQQQQYPQQQQQPQQQPHPQQQQQVQQQRLGSFSSAAAGGPGLGPLAGGPSGNVGVVRAGSPVGSLHNSLPGPGRVWREGEGEGLGPLASGLVNSPKKKSGEQKHWLGPSGSVPEYAAARVSLVTAYLPQCTHPGSHKYWPVTPCPGTSAAQLVIPYIY